MLSGRGHPKLPARSADSMAKRAQKTASAKLLVLDGKFSPGVEMGHVNAEQEKSAVGIREYVCWCVSVGLCLLVCVCHYRSSYGPA